MDNIVTVGTTEKISRLDEALENAARAMEVQPTATELSDAEKACSKILLITFTDAGCREMKERVSGKLREAGLDISPDCIQAKTFNQFAYEIVLDNYAELGFTAPPMVIDHIRNRRIITELLNGTIISGLNYLNFSMSTPNMRGALACAEKCFDVIKSQRIDPDSPDADGEVMVKLSDAGYYRFMQDQGSISSLLLLYKDYAARLIEENLLTFADQEPMMFKILKAHPGYFDRCGYEHVIVDEFQDSNDVQMETIRELCNAKCFKSLMVVGDDSQSIFGFRDTTPENILNFFDKLGRKGEDLYLVDNYRSTPEIIELANKIESRNEHRTGKTLVSKRANGCKPIVHGFDSSALEYEYIAEKMKDLIDEKGYLPEEIAFIAATNEELRKFSAVLSSKDIPWVLMNPMILSKNSRVMAAQALADGIRHPEAESCFFTYLTAVYDGDILSRDPEEIREEVSQMRAYVESTFYSVGEDALSFEQQRARFHQWLEAIRSDDEIYGAFLDLVYANPDLPSELEYMSDFKAYGEDEAKRMSQQYAGVVLTTAHSSKGLEWRVVFNSISKYDGKLLHKGRKSDDAKEEKRRLLFVSLTRARDILFVTGEFVAYKEKLDGAAKGDDVYNQFLHEVYEDAGKEDEWQAELLAMRQRQSAKEAEAKRKRNERAREKRALGKAASLPKVLPGQQSFC